MSIYDRNEPVDPEELHGGPRCSDSMMKWAYERLEWFDKTAWERIGEEGENATFTVSMTPSGFPGEDKADFSCTVIGGVRSYVAAMINYIKHVEEELAKSPFPGIEPHELEKRSIHTATADKIIFEGGSMIVRKGMNWEWSTNTE